MNAAAQTIRRGRKFDQVIDGARVIFLRDEFERASVDDIAREAGVSKAPFTAISLTSACSSWKSPSRNVAGLRTRPKR
jgi:hypothetical protein